ncbi:unnamed protein product [Coccothraustes coccothraustes]
MDGDAIRECPSNPGAPGATLSAQLPPCQSPQQPLASGRDRASLSQGRTGPQHLTQGYPGPGAVPVQGTVPKPGHEDEAEPGEFPSWLSLVQQAAGLMEVKANPAPALMKSSSLL